MAYVQKSGTSFTLDGSRWRPFGATIYNSTNPQTTTLIDARIQNALDMNLNILRVVNFLPGGSTAGLEYSESHWAAIDYVLHRCQQTGLKLLLDCSDYCAKEMGRGVSPANQDWDDFAEFVCDRVNTYNSRTYKTDDTIAMITMAGEISTSYNGELEDFFAHSTQTFKAKGANQLTGVGSIEYYHTEIDAVAAIPTLDYIGTHVYSNNLGSNPEQYIAQYAQRATSNNKPWLFEEFGHQAKIGDKQWSSAMRAKFNLGMKYGVSGFLYWNLAPTSTQPNSSDDYNIGPTGNAPLTEKTVKMYSIITSYSPRIPITAADFAGYP